jgi:hypothetical protein
MMKNAELNSIISALSSCAIEGNTLAIRLLDLLREYPEEFVRQVEIMGWIKDARHEP